MKSLIDPFSKVPVFDGTGDVREFVKRFNIATKAKDLSGKLQAAWIPVFLTGPAATFYESLPSTSRIDV